MAKRPPARFVEGRLEYVRNAWRNRAGGEARKYRQALLKWYGSDKGEEVKYAEAFEICEYGTQPADKEIRRLFPFFDTPAADK